MNIERSNQGLQVRVGQKKEGVYRLAGCVLMFDKQQCPYWKMQFSCERGVEYMYLFSEPTDTDNLGHGAFVEVTSVVKKLGSYHYLEVIKLKRMELSYINAEIGLQTLPVNYCPNPDHISRFRQLISYIHCQSLLDFIAEVLMPMDICIPFFNAPASLNYHHNYAGGLFEHSIEVAEIASTFPLDTVVEKELAITSALFHDIGKIKCMGSNMRRLESGKWVDHSALTLEVCANGLRQLDKYDSTFSHILRNSWTCASPGARYGYQAKSSIAEVVQMADRYSAKIK